MRTYFLDTSAVYSLTGFSHNSRYDIESIRKKIQDEEIHISSFTIFEMLNNTRFREKLRSKILSFLNISKHIFVMDQEGKYYLEQGDIVLLFRGDETINTKLYATLSQKALELYIITVTNNTILAFSLYFRLITGVSLRISRCAKRSQIKLFDYLSMILEKLQLRIKLYVTRKFSDLLSTATFSEKHIKKEIKSIFSHLANSFAPVLNKAEEIYVSSGNSPSCMDFHKIRSLAQYWYDHTEFEKLFVSEFIVDYSKVNVVAALNQRRHDSSIEEKLMDMVINSIPFPSSGYSFETLFIKRFLRKVYFGELSFKSNDIIDEQIVNAYMDEKSDCIFVSFDTDFVDILKNATEQNCINSMKWLETFEIS